MGDLRNVLTVLNGAINAIDENLNCNSSTQVSSPNDKTFPYGEHLACVRHDETENCLKWYVGVVDVVDGEDMYVSYMKMSDKQGLRWLFPDETDIHKTSPEQVLLRNIPIFYSSTAMIRCQISAERLKKIQSLFNNLEI